MRFAQHMMTWGSWAHKNNEPFNFDAMLDDIQKAGFEGVEIGGDEKSLGKPAELKRKLADHGLEIAAFGSGVTANPYPPNTEQYRKEMDFAAELGVQVISVCGGFLGEQRRTTFESDYALFAENMAEAVEYAKKNGQIIAYHPHCGCIVETIAEVKRIWKYLPDLPLCIDTGHLAAVRDDAVELIELRPDLVKHLHLKDWHAGRRRFANLGEGDAGVDFTRVLRALKNIGYTGWMAVELDTPLIPAGELAIQSRQFLRECEEKI